MLRWTTFMALILFPLAACDDDSPTTPGADQEGIMEAVIQDNGGSQSPAQAWATEGSGEVSGQFEGQARIEVMVDGAWQQVSGLANMNAEAQLGGGESTMGSATVEARTYERVRVVVSNANADVDAGSDIGIGPIEASISVIIAGGGDVVIEYNQPVTVQADASTRLVLDINSELWLTGDALEAGAVSSAAFQSAATVIVH